MKSIISNINKFFESRVRLGIMSILMIHDKVDFNTLKDTLNLTDGNLASHLRALENKKYIEYSKEFAGRKTQTTYKTTVPGRHAFTEHINALEKLIKEQE
ncbi:MAG: transcriptional regulator [Chlorobi bacterium]|nr:transcriptional regulator [Chlorobiota bacterium]